MGPIGLLQVQLARLAGASKIMAVDVVESKLELAKQFGADVIVNANDDSALDVGMEQTDDVGFDSVIDTTSVADVVEEAFHLTARGGTMNFFAVYPMDYMFPFHLATGYFKEITLRSTFFYPYLIPRALAMLPRLQLKPLISKVFDLKDGVAAFEANKDKENIKILIKSN
jgi:(R,R)-butanediol dehydrogenase/meso-butanediol dehydrogenase/diacetyl reductase